MVAGANRREMTDKRWSLVEKAWLPVQRQFGQRGTIRPADLTEKVENDPVVALDWPRADFDAGCLEFLIGLVSTACWQRVSDAEAWEDWWHEPPSPDELEACFAPFADAFVLDGDGPRFMQDLDADLASEPVPVGSLLIDTPGANALRKNRDLFVKRGRIETLSRASAAMALFTLQTFAPAGGAGHRTSLRGGGPLTTLVVPPGPDASRPPTLWHLIWLNVFWDDAWGDPTADLGRVFPWLAPTRLSDKGQITTPGHVHPGQVYFGMPRRIRLDIVPNEARRPCDLTGVVDAVVVQTYRTRPHGCNYERWSRAHPLSAHYQGKPGDPASWLPVHPQPGRLGYREWLALVLGDHGQVEKATRWPAAVVSQARERLRHLGTRGGVRLLAHGFDMDNMTARGFVETRMPLPLVDDDVRASFDRLARELVKGAREAEGLISMAVGHALPNQSGSDKGERRLARDRFWDRTEDDFFRLLRDLPERLRAEEFDTMVVREAWRGILRRISLAIFDALVPLDDIEERDIERLVRARRNLAGAFRGFGAGARLFTALNLPPPESGKRRKSA